MNKDSHARQRAVERYGKDLCMPLISQIVRDGGAKFFAPSKDGCAFYDVPYRRYAGEGPETVRVLMSANNRFVITVLPPKTAGEIVKPLIKQRRDARAEQRRKFFRGFQDDEEDCVTA